MRGSRRILARLAGVAVSAAVCAAAISGAGAAWAAPELRIAAGSTLGVTGNPGTGGSTVSLGTLWPVNERFAFGVDLFADDLGTGLADLHDPNTGTALGTVASTHRWSFGGEWRGEARLREGRRVRLLWGAGFGYGRQEQDQRGEVRDAASGVVASSSATFLYKTGGGHAFGTTLAFRREFVHRESDPDRSTSWATAAIEWRWKRTVQE
ncbi:MAG TPA: hypothetical protein VI504_10195 [Candidatus Eisenbacteria bacterium]|jgi:hypothetical protein